MNDEQLETELRSAVRSYGESVHPADRLGAIRARTQGTQAPASTAWWRPWVLAAGAGLVAASVVVGAVVLVDTSGDEPPVAGGAERQVTMYYLIDAPGVLRQPPDHLAMETMTTADSGNPGLDAVRALLRTRPSDPDHMNGFNFMRLESAPITDVTSVTASGGTITVNLTEDVWDPYPGVDCACPSGEIITQQLVWTVQDALNSDDPVAVTVDGEPARGIWFEPLDGPVQADPYALSPILIDSPADGATVSSPVTISGTSDTFEANVVWEVVRDDAGVAKGGTTMGGTMGERAPFEFTVDLPAGDYTARAFAEDMETGGLFAEDTVAFSVE